MQVVGEMMSVFERATSRDGTVHWHEFLDYYKDLSASMPNDAHFELMIRNAYHMSGGQGSAANSRY
jgi:calcyphosin